MKRIKELDEIVKTRDWKDTGYSMDFLQAYRETQRIGHERLDFSDILWENKMDEIFRDLEKFDIDEITISDASTALMRTLWSFKQKGFEMVGMYEIKTGYTSWEFENKREVIEMKPAILLKRNRQN